MASKDSQDVDWQDTDIAEAVWCERPIGITKTPIEVSIANDNVDKHLLKKKKHSDDIHKSGLKNKEECCHLNEDRVSPSNPELVEIKKAEQENIRSQSWQKKDDKSSPCIKCQEFPNPYPVKYLEVTSKSSDSDLPSRVRGEPDPSGSTLSEVKTSVGHSSNLITDEHKIAEHGSRDTINTVTVDSHITQDEECESPSETATKNKPDKFYDHIYNAQNNLTASTAVFYDPDGFSLPSSFEIIDDGVPLVEVISFKEIPKPLEDQQHFQGKGVDVNLQHESLYFEEFPQEQQLVELRRKELEVLEATLPKSIASTENNNELTILNNQVMERKNEIKKIKDDLDKIILFAADNMPINLQKLGADVEKIQNDLEKFRSILFPIEKQCDQISEIAENKLKYVQNFSMEANPNLDLIPKTNTNPAEDLIKVRNKLLVKEKECEHLYKTLDSVVGEHFIYFNQVPDLKLDVLKFENLRTETQKLALLIPEKDRENRNLKQLLQSFGKLYTSELKLQPLVQEASEVEISEKPNLLQEIGITISEITDSKATLDKTDVDKEQLSISELSSALEIPNNTFINTELSAVSLDDNVDKQDKTTPISPVVLPINETSINELTGKNNNLMAMKLTPAVEELDNIKMKRSANPSVKSLSGSEIKNIQSHVSVLTILAPHIDILPQLDKMGTDSEMMIHGLVESAQEKDGELVICMASDAGITVTPNTSKPILNKPEVSCQNVKSPALFPIDNSTFCVSVVSESKNNGDDTNLKINFEPCLCHASHFVISFKDHFDKTASDSSIQTEMKVFLSVADRESKDIKLDGSKKKNDDDGDESHKNSRPNEQVMKERNAYSNHTNSRSNNNKKAFNHAPLQKNTKNVGVNVIDLYTCSRQQIKSYITKLNADNKNNNNVTCYGLEALSVYSPSYNSLAKAISYQSKFDNFDSIQKPLNGLSRIVVNRGILETATQENLTIKQEIRTGKPLGDEQIMIDKKSLEKDHELESKIDVSPSKSFNKCSTLSSEKRNLEKEINDNLLKGTLGEQRQIPSVLSTKLDSLQSDISEKALDTEYLKIGLDVGKFSNTEIQIDNEPFKETFSNGSVNTSKLNVNLVEEDNGKFKKLFGPFLDDTTSKNSEHSLITNVNPIKDVQEKLQREEFIQAKVEENNFDEMLEENKSIKAVDEIVESEMVSQITHQEEKSKLKIVDEETLQHKNSMLNQVEAKLNDVKQGSAENVERKNTELKSFDKNKANLQENSEFKIDVSKENQMLDVMEKPKEKDDNLDLEKEKVTGNEKLQASKSSRESVVIIEGKVETRLVAAETEDKLDDINVNDIKQVRVDNVERKNTKLKSFDQSKADLQEKSEFKIDINKENQMLDVMEKPKKKDDNLDFKREFEREKVTGKEKLQASKPSRESVVIIEGKVETRLVTAETEDELDDINVKEKTKLENANKMDENEPKPLDEERILDISVENEINDSNIKNMDREMNKNEVLEINKATTLNQKYKTEFDRESDKTFLVKKNEIMQNVENNLSPNQHLVVDSEIVNRSIANSGKHDEFNMSFTLKCEIPPVMKPTSKSLVEKEKNSLKDNNVKNLKEEYEIQAHLTSHFVELKGISEVEKENRSEVEKIDYDTESQIEVENHLKIPYHQHITSKNSNKYNEYLRTTLENTKYQEMLESITMNRENTCENLPQKFNQTVQELKELIYRANSGNHDIKDQLDCIEKIVSSWTNNSVDPQKECQIRMDSLAAKLSRKIRDNDRLLQQLYDAVHKIQIMKNELHFEDEVSQKGIDYNISLLLTHLIDKGRRNEALKHFLRSGLKRFESLQREASLKSFSSHVAEMNAQKDLGLFDILMNGSTFQKIILNDKQLDDMFFDLEFELNHLHRDLIKEEENYNNLLNNIVLFSKEFHTSQSKKVSVASTTSAETNDVQQSPLLHPEVKYVLDSHLPPTCSSMFNNLRLHMPVASDKFGPEIPTGEIIPGTLDLKIPKNNLKTSFSKSMEKKHVNQTHTLTETFSSSSSNHSEVRSNPMKKENVDSQYSFQMQTNKKYDFSSGIPNRLPPTMIYSDSSYLDWLGDKYFGDYKTKAHQPEHDKFNIWKKETESKESSLKDKRSATSTQSKSSKYSHFKKHSIPENLGEEQHPKTETPAQRVLGHSNKTVKLPPAELSCDHEYMNELKLNTQKNLQQLYHNVFQSHYVIDKIPELASGIDKDDSTTSADSCSNKSYHYRGGHNTFGFSGMYNIQKEGFNLLVQTEQRISEDINNKPISCQQDLSFTGRSWHNGDIINKHISSVSGKVTPVSPVLRWSCSTNELCQTALKNNKNPSLCMNQVYKINSHLIGSSNVSMSKISHQGDKGSSNSHMSDVSTMSNVREKINECSSTEDASRKGEIFHAKVDKYCQDLKKDYIPEF